jgi:hypothetical protein
MRGAALMAQGHGDQDNSRIRWSKAGMLSHDEQLRDTEQRRHFARTQSQSDHAPATSVALGLLGTNAWATTVGWTLLPADVRLSDAGLAASALVWLVLGAMLHLRRDGELAQTAARWLLLCIFPVSLAAALCIGSEAIRERVHTPLSMLLCSLSLLAYGVVAVIACQAPLSLLSPVTHTQKRERPIAPRPRADFRTGVSVLMLSGALAIALFAPLMPDYTEVEAAWGDASSAGAALAAVVGGALGVSVIAVYLSALLHARAPERVYSARQRRQRIAGWLFLSLLGLVVYFSVVR